MKRPRRTATSAARRADIQLKVRPVAPHELARLAAASAIGDLVLPVEVDELALMELERRGGKARPSFEKIERRTWAARLYARDYTYDEIAIILRVTPDTISQDIKAIKEEWREVRGKEVNEALLGELEKLKELERQGWLAFNRSQYGTRTLKKKRGVMVRILKDGQTVKVPYDEESEEIKEQRDGNAAHLAQIKNVIELRLEVLGFIRRKEEKPTDGEVKVVVEYVDEVEQEAG